MHAKHERTKYKSGKNSWDIFRARKILNCWCLKVAPLYLPLLTAFCIYFVYVMSCQISPFFDLWKMSFICFQGLPCFLGVHQLKWEFLHDFIFSSCFFSMCGLLRYFSVRSLRLSSITSLSRFSRESVWNYTQFWLFPVYHLKASDWVKKNIYAIVCDYALLYGQLTTY